jgi:hypothetical protein
MKGYLGQFPVDVKQTKYKDYTPSDWAMYFIERYGQIDGAHHKLWVLDQVARILKGTPIVVEVAKWDNGVEEYRISTGDQSKEYAIWVNEMIGDDDGEPEYTYDEGIAP